MRCKSEQQQKDAIKMRTYNYVILTLCLAYQIGAYGMNYKIQDGENTLSFPENSLDGIYRIKEIALLGNSDVEVRVEDHDGAINVAVFKNEIQKEILSKYLGGLISAKKALDISNDNYTVALGLRYGEHAADSKIGDIGTVKLLLHPLTNPNKLALLQQRTGCSGGFSSASQIARSKGNPMIAALLTDVQAALESGDSLKLQELLRL